MLMRSIKKDAWWNGDMKEVVVEKNALKRMIVAKNEGDSFCKTYISRKKMIANNVVEERTTQ